MAMLALRVLAPYPGSNRPFFSTTFEMVSYLPAYFLLPCEYHLFPSRLIPGYGARCFTFVVKIITDHHCSILCTLLSLQL